MFKTVIWATDGSEAADRALPFAKDLAASGERKLVVLHVRELITGGRAGGYPVYADEDNLVEHIRTCVDDLRHQGFNVTLKLVTGRTANPAGLIATTARELEGDVIVVGSHGRGLVGDALLGSVTLRLLHVAHCPVLAVPPLDRAQLDEGDRELVATK